jgi:hypothetical protein
MRRSEVLPIPNNQYTEDENQERERSGGKVDVQVPAGAFARRGLLSRRDIAWVCERIRERGMAMK